MTAKKKVSSFFDECDFVREERLMIIFLNKKKKTEQKKEMK
jgi:hypothetical protein